MPFLISPILALHWAACSQIKKSLVYVEKQAGTDLPEGVACPIPPCNVVDFCREGSLLFDHEFFIHWKPKHAFKKTFVFGRPLWSVRCFLKDFTDFRKRFLKTPGFYCPPGFILFWDLKIRGRERKVFRVFMVISFFLFEKLALFFFFFFFFFIERG